MFFVGKSPEEIILEKIESLLEELPPILDINDGN